MSLFVATVDIFFSPDNHEEQVLGVYSSLAGGVIKIVEFMQSVGYDLSNVRRVGNHLLGDNSPGLSIDENTVHAVFGHIQEFKLDE